MKTKTILITPELATELLKGNIANRPPSRSFITDYARQMKAGLWFEETGEAIKITSDGRLVDGQQRLMALIMAGVSLNFLVTEVPNDAFKYIDSGKKRTAGDLFACSGVPNYVNIAAGLKSYVMLKRGLSIGFYKSGGSDGRTIKVSNSELYSIYCSAPHVYQGAYSNASKWYHKSGRLMKVSEAIAYYLLFRDIDENDAFDFMDSLFCATNMSGNSPIMLLRSRLYEDKVNTRYKLSAVIKTMLTIKTWNYFRKGQCPKTLQVNINRDSMPIAV